MHKGESNNVEREGIGSYKIKRIKEKRIKERKKSSKVGYLGIL